MSIEPSFSAPALPFVALTLALLALAVVPALYRGDPVVRLGFLLVAVAALPWAGTTALVGCLDDPVVGERLARAGFAPISLIGSGLLMLILGVAGKVDAHRGVLIASVLLNTALMIVAASTELVVASMQETAWGLLYPRAGALYWLHAGAIPLGVGYGVWAARGSMNWRRRPGAQPLRSVVGVGVLAVLAVSDVFLTYGVFGVYPWSWLPSLIAVGLSLHAIWWGDVLRSRGIDRAALVELGLAVAAVLVLGLIARATSAPAPLAIATGAAAAMMVATARTFARAARAPSPARAREVDGLVDELAAAERPDEVAVALADFLRDTSLLARARVWRTDGEGLAGIGRAAAPLALPAPVRAYLVKLARAFPVGDLATERLGALRPTLEAWVRTVDADVIVPLVDRDRLIGLAAGERPGARALRDGERARIDEAAGAAARALTVLSLRREIEARTALTRELELTEAVREARSAGDRRDVAGVQVAISYQAAARVAGDLWYTAALPDGRLFVLVGDVAGRGTPAALVSAAIVGACQSAVGLAAPEVAPHALLSLLHEVVVGIDGGRHRVTVLGATIDRRPGRDPRIDLAIAGHRGGFLVHGGDDGVELVPLVGQGAPLGEPAWKASTTSRPLAAGDVVLFASDGVTHARDRAGVAWGERRLQRTLRELGPRTGVALGDALVEAVTAHVGTATLEDDLLVVAIAV